MRKPILAACAVLATAALIIAYQEKKYEPADLGFQDTPMLPGQPWHVHDNNRPKPPKVTVAPAGNPVAAPSDAVVLFDGKDFSHWTQRGRRAADRGKMTDPKWKLENGYMEIVGRTGDLVSKEKFGTGHYHV
jgi:hypothetical protein